PSKNLAYKDGVFISTHKFLGGPGSSGVLVARLEIFEWTEQHSSTDRNEYIPAAPGGGTVDMVLPGRHKYIHNVIAREEAGTPNILATIRSGLVFRLQEIVDPAWILEKEYELARKILARLMAPELAEKIHVLGGSSGCDRVAVFSLTISVPRFSARSHDHRRRPPQIHYALLSTIMNDFFGVEMRGGCMCAGPYASQLLGFDADRIDKFWRLLLGDTGHDQGRQSLNPAATKNDDHSCMPSNEKHNIHQQDLCSKSLKPGFVRFSFSYFAKDKDIEFVVQSLEWVAQYGYLLIPLYQLNARTGEWSVRKAVHRAVVTEISTKHKTCRSREYCIPVAIDCIQGLQRLFREQAKFTCSTASTRSWLSPHYLAPSERTMNDQDVADHQEKKDEGPRAFYSVGQARKSLSNLFNNMFNRSDAAAKACSTPSLVPTRESSKGQSNDSHSMIMHGAHEEGDHDEDNELNGSDRRLPGINISSSNVSSISSVIEDPGRRQHVAVTVAPEANDSNVCGSSSKIKKSTVLSVKRHISTKDQQVLIEASKELSWDKLQAEVDAIETSDLAKELRWFVTPLEKSSIKRVEMVKRLTTGGFTLLSANKETMPA
ncbi:hypothetical protein BGZ65_007371, partial [Modicella reniformis]